MDLDQMNQFQSRVGQSARGRRLFNVPLRRVVRMVWWLVCTAVFLGLPILVWDFRQHELEKHKQWYLIAGIFVLMSIPISVYEVAMHFEYYSRPRLQIHVIRILWMVPVYGVDAWLCLRFPSARLYLDPAREIYEAYVIYNFYMLLIHFLEDEVGDLEQYLTTKPNMNHMWGLHRLLPQWDMGQEFLNNTKLGVLSYVVLRPLTAIVMLFTEPFGKYKEEELFSFTGAASYCWIINSAAQAWALYCLIYFYKAMYEELKPLKPLKKFIVVKLVVFFSFWQGIAIQLFAGANLLPKALQITPYKEEDDKGPKDPAEVGVGLQNFIICIECFGYALAHAYAFPPKDYRNPSLQSRGVFRNIRDMFDVRDVVSDVQDYVDTTVQRTTNTVSYGINSAGGLVQQTPFRYLINNRWTRLKDVDEQEDETGGTVMQTWQGPQTSDQHHDPLFDQQQQHASDSPVFK